MNNNTRNRIIRRTYLVVVFVPFFVCTLSSAVSELFRSLLIIGQEKVWAKFPISRGFAK